MSGLPKRISKRYALDMAKPSDAYPFQILVTFTRQQERKLKAAAAERGMSMRALIRQYVNGGTTYDLQQAGLLPLPDDTTPESPRD